MNIFVLHASHGLTDHLAHGDGLIAWGFIKTLAARGHNLWVVAPSINVKDPNVKNVHLFELKSVAPSRTVRAIQYMVSVRSLFNELSKTVDFDIVHQLNPVVRGYALAMFGVRVPLVLGTFFGDWPIAHSEGLPYSVRLRRAFASIARTLLDTITQSQARALLLTTPHALSRTPLVKITSPRVHIVPLGVDLGVFTPNALTADPPRCPNSILLVGQAKHKGVYTMLAAFEKLLVRRPEVRLKIAGGGSAASDVQRQVGLSTFRDQVDFLGSVSREKMPGVLRSVDVVCVPSHGEPYGMILVEAMATAKPIVTTRAGGVPDVVAPGGALLVPVGDAVSLARALEAVLDDPKRAATMGNANLAKAASYNSWHNAASRVEDAYAAAYKSR